MNDLGTGTVRLITKFLDKVCSEANLPAPMMDQLFHRIPGWPPSTTNLETT